MRTEALACHVQSPRRFRLLLLIYAVVIAAGAAATAPVTAGTASVHFRAHLLDPSFDPNAAVGGVPFCSSGSLGTILCYPPGFLKTAYHFPPVTGSQGLDGSGQTIVIVDAFGSPTIQSDLDKFDATFGLPPTRVDIRCGPTWTGAATDKCPVNTIADLGTVANGDACGGAAGWAEETTLDVTMSHALAPQAKIVLVVSNDCFDPNITTAEAAVVQQTSLRGSVMSQSFGEPDDLVICVNFPCTITDPTIQTNRDRVYRTATAQHWTLIASSGDDGANEALRAVGTTELTPSWPATSPLNLAAGGTQGQPYGGQFGGPPGPGQSFTCPANTNCNTGLVIINGGASGCGTAGRPGEPSSCIAVRYGGEAAWNEFGVFGIGTSTGGGVSTLYGRPDYQGDLPDQFDTLLGSEVQASGRLNPDVSFNSAIHGGVLAPLGFLGPPTVWAVFGGTSAASPAWAGIIALLNQAHGRPVGYITPRIYDLEQMGVSGSIHDIRSGNNSDTAGQFGVDGFKARSGYDLTNGAGTPDVARFISVMQNLLSQDSQGNQN
jgi:subtilase family serine protease